jgi:hypothetical protein
MSIEQAQVDEEEVRAQTLEDLHKENEITEKAIQELHEDFGKKIGVQAPAQTQAQMIEKTVAYSAELRKYYNNRWVLLEEKLKNDFANRPYEHKKEHRVMEELVVDWVTGMQDIMNDTHHINLRVDLICDLSDRHYPQPGGKKLKKKVKKLFSWLTLGFLFKEKRPKVS